MAIATLLELKEELSFTPDIGAVDDDLMARKLEAAEAHVQRLLGYTFAEEFPDGAPADLKHAVIQLAAHWYENRELVGSDKTLPFGVDEIIRERRGFTF